MAASEGNADGIPELLHFEADEPIQLDFRKTLTYTIGNFNHCNLSLLKNPNVWHQIVLPMEKELSLGEARMLVQYFLKQVSKYEFYPIKVRISGKTLRFLIRDCELAMKQLFSDELQLRVAHAKLMPITVQLNVGVYKPGQLKPLEKMKLAVEEAFENMTESKRMLNLMHFYKHAAFKDVIIGLNNGAVLARLCRILCAHAGFKYVQSIDFSYNYLLKCYGFRNLGKIELRLLDVSHNHISEVDYLCQDVRDMRIQEIKWSNNLFNAATKPLDLLIKYEHQFNYIDGTLTALSAENCIGSWNTDEFQNYQETENAIALVFPDRQHKYQKSDVLQYFFNKIVQNKHQIYPYHYKYSKEKRWHQFLLWKNKRELTEIIKESHQYLLPLFKPQKSIDDNKTPSLQFFLKLNYHESTEEWFDPLSVLETVIKSNFVNDSILNLSFFNHSEELENVYVSLSVPSILKLVLETAAAIIPPRITALILQSNNISRFEHMQWLGVLKYVQILDLSNNNIATIEDMSALHGMPLQSLNIANNPLCSSFKFAGTYIDAFQSIYGQLLILDNIELTPDILLQPKSSYLCDINSYELVNKFITNYFQIFDSDSRLPLYNWNDENILFTLSIDTTNASCSDDVLLKRLRKYLIYHSEARHGREQLMAVLLKLYKTEHKMHDFKVDVFTLTPDVITLHVCGHYIDHGDINFPISMAFSRQFVLKRLNTNKPTTYKIINDILNVQPLDKLPKTVPPPDVNELHTKHALTLIVQEVADLPSYDEAKTLLMSLNYNMEEFIIQQLKLPAEEEEAEDADNEDEDLKQSFANMKTEQ